MTGYYSSCHKCDLKSRTSFRCLKENYLTLLDNSKKSRIYNKGDYLFEKGDEANGFFCINSGTVRTFISSHLGHKELSFRIHSAGSWVGCRDAILGSFHNHSAVCIEPVKACFIDGEQIEKILQNDSDFQLELMRKMAHKWKDSEDQAYSIGTKQIHSKLAELIVALYQTAANPPEIELNFTREVMASMIGTTSESVSRALSDFKVRDWLHIERNKIIVSDIDSLYAISEMSDQDFHY